MIDEKKNLWFRWTTANAVSEMLGLGITFAVIGFAHTQLEDELGVTTIVLLFAIAVLAGAIEATVVALAQWWAMHPWFPSIGRLEWWRATLIGAEIAYILGYLPSTIMNLAAPDSAAPVAEPAQWIVLLMAVGMGAIGGVILSFMQWRVLRRYVVEAGRWIPANMLAWGVGMPIIFAGIDLGFAQRSNVIAFLIMAATFLLAGAVVGAIHGRTLTRMRGKDEG